MNPNRRQFIRAGIVGTAAFSKPIRCLAGSGDIAAGAKDPFRGLKVGVASYSLRKFSLDQAISMTSQLGVKYITLKDFHLPLNSTRAERREARRKIEDAGLVLMGGGVIYMKNDESEIRHAFDYARDAAMPTIVASPAPAALDTLDKMVNEYNIRVAIHNHGPGDELWPSPYDVFPKVEDHDERMGLCIDIGHTVRIGVDPIQAVRRCASRLYDLHYKDVTSATPQGKNVEVGRGIVDIVGLLKALLDISFQYQVALEYEINETEPLPGMIESYAYTRGVLASIT